MRDEKGQPGGQVEKERGCGYRVGKEAADMLEVVGVDVRFQKGGGREGA